MSRKPSAAQSRQTVPRVLMADSCVNVARVNFMGPHVNIFGVFDNIWTVKTAVLSTLAARSATLGRFVEQSVNIRTQQNKGFRVVCCQKLTNQAPERVFPKETDEDADYRDREHGS